MRSALRFAAVKAKQKVDRPIETMTSFRPFTVRELDFDVWEDFSNVRSEQFLQQYEELGLIGGKANQAAPAGGIQVGQLTSSTLAGPGGNFLAAPQAAPSLGNLDLRTAFQNAQLK